MELAKLFEIQRKLDAEIEAKHSTAAGEDRLAKRILALQVELGECANEWRGFKFWSTDQRARIHVVESYFSDHGGYNTRTKNPLLEEYVDCLHFVLSIGNHLTFNFEEFEKALKTHKMPNLTDQYMWVNKKLLDLYEDLRDRKGSSSVYHYLHLFNGIIGLGEMLGFTWEEIETAYYSKNQINHQRQQQGY